MSKAFTREDDSGDTVIPRPVSPLPPGARNYLTSGGAARLRGELTRLREVERAKLVADTAEEGAKGADAKDSLQRIDHRIAYLEESLRTAEVTVPPPPPHDVVRFGATVTVCDPRGREMTYRIVGVDEADTDKDEVSWQSPIARALLNARLGDRVKFKFPTGASELEVVSIRYLDSPR